MTDPADMQAEAWAELNYHEHIIPEPESVLTYPFVHASHIVLREAIASGRIWIASIEGKSYATDPYATGPVVKMTRGGATAAEAYGRIVESLFEQGWTVR